ncbi:MAG: hypothetical protein IJP66_04565, partial [Kiritimatiellae bacterium]|nr:hypothetical protein [Kiritimatiellia bacterium]
NALAVGYHRDLRATWKRQLRHPAVAAILAGYGIDAAKAAREEGAFWTFLLAIGEDAASAALPDDRVGVTLAAASPMGRRALLLRLFHAIRWVPGLGRIHRDPDGNDYINLHDPEKDSFPIILSVALTRGILLAKLSNRPQNMDDMRSVAAGGNGFAARLQPDAVRPMSHRLVILPQSIPGAPLSLDREVRIDAAFDGNAATVSATFPLPEARRAGLSSHRLAGGNDTAGALAADHSFALALLPAPFAADAATRALACGGVEAPGGDAALYLTGAPYGGQFMIAAIPALTAVIPGLSVDEAQFKSRLRQVLPKQLAKTAGTIGGNVLCTSAASLRQQRHAAPPPPFTWRDSYARFAADAPSAFLHLDLDPLFLELRNAAQAVLLAASFARDAVSPDAVLAARLAAEALPGFPTRSYAAAALSFAAADGDECRATLLLSPKP